VLGVSMKPLLMLYHCTPTQAIGGTPLMASDI
jgi:hypothetical protein